MIAFSLAGFYYFYFSLIAVHVIFFPKVLNLLGYSAIELSIIMAASPLVRFIAPYLFLKYINLNRKVFFNALILTVISAIAVYWTIDHFWLLFIVAVILGFGLSLVLPYVELIALEKIAKENYGKVRLYGSVGFIVVSLILVRFLDNPYNAIHFLVGVASFLAVFGVIILLVIKEEVGEPSHEELKDIKKFKLSAHTYLWISLFLMQLAFMPFYNFFLIYETAAGLSAQTTIYLWSFGVLFEIGMLYFQGPLFHKFKLIDLLIFTTGITVVRWLIIFFFNDNLMLLYLSQALHAFSFGLYHSAAVRYLFTIYPQKKLAQQFFFGISYGLGAFIGSIFAGVIYEYNPDLIYLYASIMTLFATIFLVKERQSHKVMH